LQLVERDGPAPEPSDLVLSYLPVVLFPDTFPEMKRKHHAPAPGTRRKALSAHRRRLKRRGIVRVEVHVRKNDADLLRDVARALSDPAREVEARLLRERFGASKAGGLKALLAAAPLEGIDLTRERDLGRDIVL
jgi:hypothetical protein